MSENIHIDSEFSRISEFLPESGVVIIADSFFRNSPLISGLPYPIIFIEADERSKTLSTVETVMRSLMEMNADRDIFLVGMGGGITTDITGFVASTYKRGVRFGLIPTTLLSQVDASIGGKNGVNFDGFKNVIGCFKEPEFIYICPSFILTLPPREVMCGLAEMAKMFLIADSNAYETLVSDWRGNLDELIGRAVEIKSEIVQRDPFDFGERHLLNLGHTFAHAIEKVSDKFLHGEAVAIGIVMAGEMSVKLGLMTPLFLEKMKKDFSSLGLPIESGVDTDMIEKAVLQDKKRKNGKTVYVLPVEPGKVILWEKSVSV